MAKGTFIIAAENRIHEGLDAAKRDLSTFEQDSGSTGKKILENFTVTFGDIKNVVMGAFSTVGEFINSYAEAERSLNALKAAIDISPKVDTSALESLTGFASQLQGMAGISDDTTISLSAMLISTGRTAEETIDILKLAADYSAATGRAYQSSVEQINKTFGGAARELGQYFPELKDLTEEQMAAGGAIDVLKEKFGGFTEKMAGSASTSINKFNETWGDMKEALGEAIMPTIQPVLEWLVTFLNDPVIPLLKSFAPIVQEVFENAEKFITDLKPAVEPILKWFGEVWTKTIGPNIKSIGTILKETLNLVSGIINGDWARVWDSLKNAVTAVVDMIKRAFQPIIDAVNTVIEGIQKAIGWLGGNKKQNPNIVNGKYVDPNTGKTYTYDENTDLYYKDGKWQKVPGYAKGTSGALPGVALVGEKGPELVIFNGGETVIPNNDLPLVAKTLGIPGYAAGTLRGGSSAEGSDSGGGVNFVMPDLLDEIIGGLAGSLGELMSALGPFGNMIAGMNPLLAILLPVIEGFVAVMAPVIQSVLAPLMDALTQLGVVLAQTLLPIIDLLSPVINLIANILMTVFAPVLQILAPIIQLLAAILQPFIGVITLLAKVFTVLMAPVQWLADLFSWMGDVLQTFAWNIMHPFRQQSGPGSFYSDAFSGLSDRLAAIDALAANNQTISSAVSSSTASTASQSASYRTQQITINIYQQAPVVGSGGMDEFVGMIRTRFNELAYFGATA